jgi:exosortase family protein XrtF
MKAGFEFIRENKKAIRFLLVFSGFYFALNTAYGFFIQYYYPSSDPFTQLVTRQVVWIISWFDSSVSWSFSPFTNNVAVLRGGDPVIYVFEGCNGLNVMIVYVGFLLAFQGSLRQTLKFASGGLVAIHLVNLLRVGLLYFVALYFEEQLYFFHKYLFTGMIYGFVFVMWYYWVRSVTNE